MKTALELLLLFIISLTLTTSLSAEYKGKIMTKAEGEALFGKDITTHVIWKRSAFEEILKKADVNVMLMIKGDKLIVATTLDNILTEGYERAEEDVFHVFSKTVVEALLNYMNNGLIKEEETEKEEFVSPENISFEMRGDVMTVTYGNYLMEFSFPCPPWCE